MYELLTSLEKKIIPTVTDKYVNFTNPVLLSFNLLSVFSDSTDASWYICIFLFFFMMVVDGRIKVRLPPYYSIPEIRAETPLMKKMRKQSFLINGPVVK